MGLKRPEVLITTKFLFCANQGIWNSDSRIRQWGPRELEIKLILTHMANKHYWFVDSYTRNGVLGYTRELPWFIAPSFFSSGLQDQHQQGRVGICDSRLLYFSTLLFQKPINKMYLLTTSAEHDYRKSATTAPVIAPATAVVEAYQGYGK